MCIYIYIYIHTYAWRSAVGAPHPPPHIWYGQSYVVGRRLPPPYGMVQTTRGPPPKYEAAVNLSMRPPGIPE